MDERINALAEGLAQRFGVRALDVVIRQFDAAEGDVKRVWGRIMEWLILFREEQCAALAEEGGTRRRADRYFPSPSA